MSLLVVGLSHRTAPVRVLERVTLDTDAVQKALHELISAECISEALIVSTCNRIEVYADADRFHPAVSEIGMLLGRQTDFGETLADYCFVHYAEAAIQHLFSVSAGLDSMVVGESQILGQVRTAYAASVQAGAAGPVLHELAQTALRVGKRVRSETGIDRAGQSVVSVGLDFATKTLGSLAGRRAVVVGAGSMGSLAVASLLREGVSELVVVNRTVERAVELATGAHARAAHLDDIAVEIEAADIVVAATGAVGAVIDSSHVLARPAGRPLVLLDLGLPRDVDEAVAQLPGVTLIELESMRAAGAVASDAEVFDADAIVAQELRTYLAAQQQQALAPTITALRSRAGQVVDAEVYRLMSRLPDIGPAARAEIEQTVRRAVDKVLHTPTVRVKELAARPGGESYAQALRELFDLDPAAAGSVGAIRPDRYEADGITDRQPEGGLGR